MIATPVVDWCSWPCALRRVGWEVLTLVSNLLGSGCGVTSAKHACSLRRGNFAQFEEMYEQKRTEVNKAAEKYEKAIKAAKRSGNKANQVLAHPNPGLNLD